MSRRTPSRAARTRRRAAERAARGKTRMRIPDHLRAPEKKRQEDPRDRS